MNQICTKLNKIILHCQRLREQHGFEYEQKCKQKNDARPKLLQLLKDETITMIAVEHKDRLTRFGFNYLKTLWDGEIVVINEVVEDEKDLMQDFVSLVTSFTARLYGKRRSKRATEKLIKDLNAKSV